MKRDPDYLWSAIEVGLTGLGALVAIAICCAAVRAIEWVWP